LIRRSEWGMQMTDVERCFGFVEHCFGPLASCLRQRAGRKRTETTRAGSAVGLHAPCPGVALHLKSLPPAGALGRVWYARLSYVVRKYVGRPHASLQDFVGVPRCAARRYGGPLYGAQPLAQRHEVLQVLSHEVSRREVLGLGALRDEGLPFAARDAALPPWGAAHLCPDGPAAAPQPGRPCPAPSTPALRPRCGAHCVT
jgi:hypothetical protein